MKKRSVFKNKKVWIPLSIILILLIGFICYQKIFNNPKNIFLNYANNAYKDLTKLTSSLKDNEITKLSKNNPIRQTSNISFKLDVVDEYSPSNIEGLIDEINKFKLITDSYYDIKNKEIMYDFNLKYGKDSLLNLKTYGLNKKIYAKLENAMDYYLKIDTDSYDQLFETNSNLDEAEVIISEFKDTLLSNISDKDFKTEKSNLLIDSKVISTKKITYELTPNKARLLVRNTLNDLKNNNKFINSLTKITGYEKEDILEELNDLIESLKENIDDDHETMEFNIYTKGLDNKVIKSEFIINMDDEKIGIEVVDYTNQSLKIVDGEDTLLNVYIENIKGQKNITVDMSYIKLVIKEIGSDEYKYSFIVDDEEVITGELKRSSKTIKKNKEYSENIVLTANFKDEGEEILTLTFNGEAITKIGEKLDIPSFDGAKDIESLTSSDYENITNKIMTNEKIQTFVDNISKYMY